MEIDLKGDIVDNATGDFFDWFGMTYVSPKNIEDALKSADGEDVQLNISSNGGDVFAASEMYTMLKMYSGKVTGIIQGMAASAATIVAEACDYLSISPAGQMMIHQASNDPGPGNSDDMAHNSTVLNKVDQTIAGIYVKKTGKSMDQVLDLMKNETFLTAEEAVREGFADNIMFVEEEAPLVTNSLATQLPAKNKVKEFLSIIGKSNSKIVNHDKKSVNDDLFLQKLDILKGK